MWVVTRMDRWRKEEVRSRVIVRGKKGDKVKRKVLKWCGHVESMNDDYIYIYIYIYI